MVLFFTSTLLFSAMALALLLGIKRYELTTGRVVGASVRPHSARFFHGVALWIERIIPTLVRLYSKLLWRKVTGFIHRTSAFAIVATERRLEHVLHTLRHKTNVRHTSGEASGFLREVSEHKRQLLRGESAALKQRQD